VSKSWVIFLCRW